MGVVELLRGKWAAIGHMGAGRNQRERRKQNGNTESGRGGKSHGRLDYHKLDEEEKLSPKSPFLRADFPYVPAMNSESHTQSAAGDPSPQSALEVVQAFVGALERLDLDAAVDLASDEIRWVNVPWKTASNKEGFRKVLHGMFKDATRFEVQYFDIHERGDGVVYTDRVDIFEGGGMSMNLPVQGEFRVKDGLVTEWVDRFSWAKVIGDIGRSLPGILKFRLGR